MTIPTHCAMRRVGYPPMHSSTLYTPRKILCPVSTLGTILTLYFLKERVVFSLNVPPAWLQSGTGTWNAQKLTWAGHHTKS